VKKIARVLHKVEESLLIVFFSTMCIMLTMQILFRYVFNAPISFTEELSRYLQIWITFIGIGFGIRYNAHISLTLFKEKMGDKVGNILSLICYLLIIIVSVLILIASPDFLRQQNKNSSVMQIPMELVYGSIPVGFISCIMYTISKMVRVILCMIGKEKA